MSWFETHNADGKPHRWLNLDQIVHATFDKDGGDRATITMADGFTTILHHPSDIRLLRAYVESKKIRAKE